MLELLSLKRDNSDMNENNSPQLDPRLMNLFHGDLDQVTETCMTLINVVFDDPELEQEMIERIQELIDEKDGFLPGELCMALILGELRSAPATSVFLQALREEDEMLQRISIRSLQRIGDPAFEAILEMLEDSHIEGETAALALEALEGISLHDLPQQRSQIEERLRRDLLATPLPLLRREAAALALARLGMSDSIDLMENVLEKDFPLGNVVIMESLESLQENPLGNQGIAEDPIENVLSWLELDLIPGGEIELSPLLQEGIPPTGEVENVDKP